MKLLLVGTGGVGEALIRIINMQDQKGEWVEQAILADYNPERPREIIDKLQTNMANRYIPEQVNAKNIDEIVALAKKYEVDYIVNGCDPSFVPTIMDAALEAETNYMDFTCSWSIPDKDEPYKKANVKTGDIQFEKHEAFLEKGLSAVIGVGADPGMSQVFARYAQEKYFDKIKEINIRDGANLGVPGKLFSFGFSIQATIEECLNPPLVYDVNKGGFYCTKPFEDAEIFDFPEIGLTEVVNIEHEEVAYIPRYIDCEKVTFKYALEPEFIKCLEYLEALNLSRSDIEIDVNGEKIKPVDFVAKCLPSPTDEAKEMRGKTCVGTWVIGDYEGKERSIFLYQISDNEKCLEKFDCQVVSAQTAFSPAIVIELLAKGIWKNKGVNTLEYFDPKPFIERMALYGFPGGIREMDSEYKREMETEALA